jgi:hypothetical protein
MNSFGLVGPPEYKTTKLFVEPQAGAATPRLAINEIAWGFS